MAEIENSKDLISVLWSGADILRSKMDANEYKDYLLGIVFYKYLSDSFLIKVYDLLYDEKPSTLKAAFEAYKEALEDESAEELKGQLIEECHYVMEPELTYTYFAEAARNNSFNREQLQKGFNNIEQSDPTLNAASDFLNAVSTSSHSATKASSVLPAEYNLTALSTLSLNNFGA